MENKGISRKDFLRKSGLGIIGLNFGTMFAAGQTSFPAELDLLQSKPTKNAYQLKNVLLETGFIYDNEGNVIHTKTDLFTISIANGVITAVDANQPNNAQAIDMKGLLMLPSFKDMHIHLDKTYYGGSWQAKNRTKAGVKGMIAFEQDLLPSIEDQTQYRAEKIMELLQKNGTSITRSHVNIEPTSKLRGLDEVLKVLDKKKDNFSAEIVAFPQHGVYYTDSVPYLREAAKLKTVDFIGGVDPYSIDGAIEKTVDFTVQLALDNNKGIDIHLHETNEAGLKTVEYIIDKVNENPALKNKTFLSHCFILGRLESKKQEEIAAKLGDAGIGVISTIPFGRLTMPIPTLYKHNVTVYTGNDSIMDHWDSFGTGNVLQKANLMAQLYGYSSEFDLSRSLKIATANVLPLNDKGEQQWPKKQDAANLVFVDASCSAEAVARISPVKQLVHQGNFVAIDTFA
ncbi:amidohydrolase family protein [Flavobacterium agricola]|uniref:Amidohydrolase family protein n=1 Tax=Flavobacterium agricola TaxID=2870839 RepID=A0ABY6M3E6_9FLAO|nr:amidohydrolase [Flavobacterium agricola]UYW02412.1 amidohydrolase family protein [Flavobacterium agricola]